MRAQGSWSYETYLSSVEKVVMTTIEVNTHSLVLLFADVIGVDCHDRSFATGSAHQDHLCGTVHPVG